ncbi:hypothetical protein CAEBREN_13600 [Caenorhabditis brenneri]|uniref:Receptor L-domain domain-containing protein n=1 Tax=Caenorhabditis brenneri TaxID=135651 RepID=G0MUC2_CAEBE|nr:hypothetical protein CAEBREN_13600 [Caenorhabditis brenneri]
MIFQRILLFCTLPSIYCSNKYEQDLKHVLDSYMWKDPNCTFNHFEINSTTIKSFPQCSNVYGILVINEKTDLNLAQLQNRFKNLRKLYGGIIIENTNWTSVSIFPTNLYINLYCENYVFHIRNNSKLTDGQLLWDLDWIPNENREDCDFRVENNPQLDMEYYCESENLEKLLKIRTSGNLKNCGCQGDQITSETLPSYSKCTKLFNGLKLSNITDLSSLSALSNIREIRGDIDIQNTSIQNLTFLENMLRWKGFQNFLHGSIIANFENLHPEFCVTIEEILKIFELQLSFVHFHGKVCDETGDIGDLILCRFKSMNELPNNCQIILGDFVIEKGDEDHFTKLPDLTLIIDSDPVFQIIGNKNLKNPTIETLWSIITRDEKREAVFQDNRPDIFPSGVCRLVTEFYGSVPADRKYRTRLNYIGGDCGEYVQVKSSEDRKIWSLLMSILAAQLLVYGRPNR